MGKPVTLPLLILALTYLASLLLRAGLVRRYLLAATDEPPPLPPGTLTLAQPILSGDPLLEERLEENLHALADQAFLWMVDADDAEALRISARLAARHPQIDLRIVESPPCPAATNPKLWKLREAATLATTAKFGVLDDDTILPRRSAAALVAASGTATVATALPFYEPRGRLPTALLAQFVDNNSPFTYLGTSCLRPPITLNGMAYILDLEELHRLGDFQPILHELTDDLAMATHILRHGGRIAQTSAPALVRTSVPDLRSYREMMHRWYVFTLLLLRRQPPDMQLLIFALHGLPPILLLAAATLTLIHLSAPGVVILGTIFIVRAAILIATQRALLGTSMHRPTVSILSELLQPFHLLHALAVRTIRWRTRRYHVRASDRFSDA